MDRQLPRLPRWSPDEAKRRLQASRALRFEASRWRWTRTPTGRRLLVGAVALGWAIGIMVGGPGSVNYLHMFDAWEMQSANAEQAREATGLLIVAGWMGVLAMRGKRAIA